MVAFRKGLALRRERNKVEVLEGKFRSLKLFFVPKKEKKPIYKPYRCAAPLGMVFAPFWSEHGYTLCPFGLVSGMVFERATECINVFIVSIPNEEERKRNMLIQND